MATQAITTGDDRELIGTSDGPTKIFSISGTQLGATGNTYADGELIGNLFRLRGAVHKTKGKSTLMSIVLHDLDDQKSKVELVVFDSNPSGTTFTDNAALDIDDADLPKITGRGTVEAGHYQSYADNAAGVVGNIGVPCKAAVDKDLWACFVCRGAATYVANKLSAKISFYG